MKRDKLVAYLDDFLAVDQYQDYAPNGLQVEGTSEVHTLVTGVTACQALIDAAIKVKADAILVHHGYFWKSESLPIVGMKQKRIKSLLVNDINLLGYHLPLDGHAEIGNNAQLGRLWQLEDVTPESGLLRLGRLETTMTMDEFKQLVSATLGREALHLPGGKEQVKTVAWCSGGAQQYITQAAEWGADVYISGEVSEQTTHLAKELGLHYLAAGHHATESLGVTCLGEHLAERFGLVHCHIDIANPV
ncbi:GTP cyclohydrolase 1 type 2 homolog YbgI [hydrothermal vent metagenome]|uniref:GTP cyclohydrolase 1 type 2 homolog YbgI n=1 Tax=hydrothermal vent metagenome TaxID=652676 RepID=A0A3B0WC23_9ZZZZ